MVGQRVSQSASDSGELGADLAAVRRSWASRIGAGRQRVRERGGGGARGGARRAGVRGDGGGGTAEAPRLPAGEREGAAGAAGGLAGAMAKKVDADGGAKYKLRQQTVEPVFYRESGAGIPKLLAAGAGEGVRGVELGHAGLQLQALALQQQAAAERAIAPHPARGTGPRLHKPGADAGRSAAEDRTLSPALRTAEVQKSHRNPSGWILRRVLGLRPTAASRPGRARA